MDNPVVDTDTQEEETISRNKYRKVLMRYFLTEGLLEVCACSRRPITMVTAKFQDGEGNVFENFGYSKVAHPDEWSAKEGLKRALLRAASNAAKDYVNKLLSTKGTIIKDKYGKRKIEPTACIIWKLGDDTPLPFGVTISDLIK